MKIKSLSAVNLHTAYINKINPLGSSNPLYLGAKSDLLVDKNYNCSLINFRGAGDNRYSSFENKVSTALNFMKDDDVLLAGKDIEGARKDFLENLETYPEIVSRIFFVEDENLDGNIAIARNHFGDFYMQNLSDAPIYRLEGEKSLRMNKSASLKITPESAFVFDGRKTSFRVAKNQNASIGDLIKSKIQIHDFSHSEQEAVYKINRSNLEKMGTKSIRKQSEKIKFSDIGGLDKTIKEIKESVIFPIKYPEAFEIVNHGVILEGEPGTGKSMIAQAAANESGVHFIKLNGLELESKWIGESAANWRKLFEEARENQPCVIFIDEFDAVARKREGDNSTRHDDKVVNQILTLMSDIEKDGCRIFVMAATNKKELLDEAIVRSGRFGKTINIPLPDEKGCLEIFNIYTKNKKIDEKFSPQEFAKKLSKVNASGADIAAIVEEARKFAYKREDIFAKMEQGTFDIKDVEKIVLTQEDFDSALDCLKKKDEVRMGFVS